MGGQEVRIRLTADTSPAQQEIKLIDQQINDLGSDKSLDMGLGDSLGEFQATQKRFIESFNSYVNATASNTQKIIAKLEDLNKRMDKVSRRDADEVYRKKLKELEDQKKLLEAQLKPPASGGGASSSPGSSSPTPTPGSGEEGGLGQKLKSLTGSLGKLATVIGVGKAVWGYVSAGAAEERSIKSQAYGAYNRTDMYGSDYSKARTNAHKTGVGYGYDAKTTIGFQSSLMSRAGFTTQENLKADTQSLMAVSKAYGMDVNRVGDVAGKYSQTGVIQSGDQVKFANLLATSVREAGMTGREDEQLGVLDRINDNLERNLVNVNGENVAATLGLYDMLAKTNENLKGQRGSDTVSAINDAIAGGGSKMDILLGWGTKYTGAEGRWALEEQKAKGVSDPENMKTIVNMFESITGQTVDSAQGKLALKQQFGLTPEEVNELVKNAPALRDGTYSQSISEAIDSGVGAQDIDKKLKNYNDSSVSTEEQYEINKKNAQAGIGEGANSVFNLFKGGFNNLSTGHQAAVGLGGTAAAGWGTGKAVQWGLGKVGNLFKGGSSAGGAASGVGDAARAATSGLDDAARAAAGSMDDVARAAAGGAEDFAKGATKATAGLSKAAKIIGVAGIALEVIATGIDVKEAIDEGDNKKAAEAVGGGAGSILGGIAGGAAAGAIAGTVVPGLGNVAGAIIGGVGGLLGALGGRWLGKKAGGAVYDGVTGGQADGSHATGNDYIPYDGYRAITHKGEAILTAHEASQWRSGNTESSASGSAGAAAISQQSKVFGQVVNVNQKVVDKYGQLIGEESDLLDRREDLYSKYSAKSAGGASSSSDPFSALMGGNDQYNVGLTSSNLKESKSSGFFSKLANIFGFGDNNSASNFGSGGGFGGGGYNGGGAASSNGYGGASSGGSNKLVQGGDLAEWTSNMIHGYEGNYSSINYNDNGAVSVGKIQWHASRAKDLLNRIKDADPSGFSSIIQQYGANGLASSLASGDNWGTHIVSKGSAEASAMQALLGSEVGKQIQDALMVSDIQSYIDKGKGMGLTDPKALAFYSDLVNQYGSYNKTINEKIIPQALSNGGSLKAMYDATLANFSQYQTRRGNVYNQISGADFSGFQDKAVGMDRVPYDGYPIRAHKDETLLTANEGKEYREGKSLFSMFGKMTDPFKQLSNEATPEAELSQSSAATSNFEGTLKILLQGSIDGMTSDNQNQIVRMVLQQLKTATGGNNSVLANLGNSMARVQH